MSKRNWRHILLLTLAVLLGALLLLWSRPAPQAQLAHQLPLHANQPTPACSVSA